MNSLTVVILALNEEIHIERCVRGAMQVARQVFVVDSFSTDATARIAESIGARVVQHAFTNHAEQLAWALEALPIETDWVMRVDADEVISPELASVILSSLHASPPSASGFLLFRQIRFSGHLIRYGAASHWVLRLWRRGAGIVEQRWMDEHMVLKYGEARKLIGDFYDDNLNGIAWWTDKHNRYSTREAIDLLNGKYAFLPATALPAKLTPQARRTRWFKEHLYARLPLGLRAFLYFGYRMVFRLGVLDGRGGFAFHFLQGCWYRYLVDMKVRAVERRMRADACDCVEAIRREFGLDPLA